ncbi:hypothetical protein [Rhodococcus globerulus]|uniref:hypothetical protein n=1 Tax=Rhodococcus globerulus TaxID=33008 RepID=UPI000A751557|nr:hypothetical protein [Rhodococcus globerulus]
MHERMLTVPDEAERKNLAGFIGHALRLDESAVIRMRRRGPDHVSVWAATGFDALATRTIVGTVNPDDTSAAGDTLLAALSHASGELIDPGFSMDSAWRGALPPAEGFEHLDDVPARVLIELAQRGNALAQEHGSSSGPPVSLLDQEVLEVSGPSITAGISMRAIFALTAMGFVDVNRINETELVRVRASRSWIRLDARFGSIYRHRGGSIPLMVAR